MSSASARGVARSLLLGLCLLVGACGFEPMYGDHRGSQTVADLSAVRIGLISDRNGQLLRRYLMDRMYPQGGSVGDRYTLEVGLTIASANFGIQRDQTSTYAQIIVSSTYALRDIKTNQLLQGGSARAVSSYNVTQDPFNILVAEADARDRALQVLANDLVTRISLYFTRAPAPVAAPS